MRQEYVIGEILEDGEIEKGYSEQGMIYKNSKAFYEKLDEICYVPEFNNTDEGYKYEDFVRIALNNQSIAEELFDSVDWQSPEVLLEEWLNEGEVHICKGCDKIYTSYEVECCPNCHQRKESDIVETEEEVRYTYITDDTEYEVTLCKELLKENDFKWESLIFADKDGELFAKVVNKSTKEWSSLTVDGLVKVVDEYEDRQLSMNEVIDLAKSSQVDDERYFIDNNNWFAMNYHDKDNYMIDDCVFEYTPKSYGELASQLIESHLSYFKNN